MVSEYASLASRMVWKGAFISTPSRWNPTDENPDPRTAKFA
jgi:hypothetical protein